MSPYEDRRVTVCAEGRRRRRPVRAHSRVAGDPVAASQIDTFAGMRKAFS
jgi:hypothetical protein